MFLRCSLFCLLAALVMIFAGIGAGHVGWWYAAGLLQAAVLLPFLLFGPARFRKRFLAIWWMFSVIAVLCLWSEGVLFIRATHAQQWRNLIGAFGVYSIFSLSIALFAFMLRPRPDTKKPQEQNSANRLILRVLGSGVSYAVYYYVFGALVFILFTKPYYTGTGPLADAQKVALSLGWWLPLIQIGRGILMTAGLLPIILGTRISRLRCAVYIGVLLWVIGGVAPLMVPSTLMPAQLRWIHMGEIFTQNFPLGLTAVFLLRKRDAAEIRQAEV